MKVIIEDKGKTYEYVVAEELIQHQRKLMMFGESRPFLARLSDGKWYVRVIGCNLCGGCCISPQSKLKDVPKYMRQLGVKRMEGKLVCRYLYKERWAQVPDDAPVDPSAPKERTLGSPLKERTNAWVYVCKTPIKPFSCCSSPLCTGGSPCAPKECTILYKELEAL